MDRQIVDSALSFAAGSEFWSQTIAFCVQYLPYLVFIGILGWFALNLRRRIFFELAGAAILSRIFITEIIRLVWDRTRPFAELGFQPMVNHAASASFPSGHAAFFFALAGVIFLHNKKMGALFVLLATVLVAARVAAGIHWPSDIMGGAVIGLGSAWIVVRFLEKKKI